jgi:type III pantothenate kinase
MAEHYTYTIDAGNTRLKLGLFNEDQLVSVAQLPLADWRRMALRPEVKVATLMSVSIHEEELAVVLKSKGIEQLQVFNAHSKLPFSSQYQQVETLGSDRKMLIHGANKLFPNQNKLIIGMGSCITYDLVNAAGEHLGGDISPGMHMRWEAMHRLTARLPRVQMPEAPLSYGRNTFEAMQSGVMAGISSELNGRIAQFGLILSELTIILSGGDAEFFEKRIDSRIFAEPNLALYGLHALH